MDASLHLVAASAVADDVVYADALWQPLPTFQSLSTEALQHSTTLWEGSRPVLLSTNDLTQASIRESNLSQCRRRQINRQLSNFQPFRNALQ